MKTLSAKFRNETPEILLNETYQPDLIPLAGYDFTFPHFAHYENVIRYDPLMKLTIHENSNDNRIIATVPVNCSFEFTLDDGEKITDRIFAETILFETINMCRFAIWTFHQSNNWRFNTFSVHRAMHKKVFEELQKSYTELARLDFDANGWYDFYLR